MQSWEENANIVSLVIQHILLMESLEGFFCFDVLLILSVSIKSVNYMLKKVSICSSSALFFPELSVFSSMEKLFFAIKNGLNLCSAKQLEQEAAERTALSSPLLSGSKWQEKNQLQWSLETCVKRGKRDCQETSFIWLVCVSEKLSENPPLYRPWEGSWVLCFN